MAEMLPLDLLNVVRVVRDEKKYPTELMTNILVTHANQVKLLKQEQIFVIRVLQDCSNQKQVKELAKHVELENGTTTLVQN